MSVSGTMIMLPKNGFQSPIRRRRRVKYGLTPPLPAAAFSAAPTSGHNFSHNFICYPRFPGELDPDVKRRLSIENYVGSLPQRILPSPCFS